MQLIQTDDGVHLYAETTGTGTPLLFIHEFAGDHRSWEPQVRYFSGAFRCVTYAARGYPPSDVPGEMAAYSQQRAIDDAIAVLNVLELHVRTSWACPWAGSRLCISPCVTPIGCCRW